MHASSSSYVPKANVTCPAKTGTKQTSCKRTIPQIQNQVGTTGCYNTIKSKLTKHNGISLATLNTRSLYPKMHEVRHMMLTTNIDILVITETWLDDTINREVEVEGYTIARNDRNRHGGGVLIYIKDGLEYQERQDLQHPDVEAVWIETPKLLHASPTLIGGYYRAPNKDADYYNNTVNMLSKAMAEDKEVLILGDFNWDYKFDETYATNPARYLEDLMEAKQLVENPTRISPTSSTTIDLIMTTSNDDHLYTAVCQTAMSDHYMPYTIIRGKKVTKQHKTCTSRCHKNLKTDDDYKKLQDDLEAALQDLPESQSTEEAWRDWTTKVSGTFDKHAPITTKRLRAHHKCYINAEMVKLMHKRDKVHRLANQKKDPELLAEYKRLRNLVTRKKRKAEKEALKELITIRRKNPTKFWKDVTAIMPRKINMASIPKNLSLDDINTYFANIGGKNITEAEYRKLKQGMPWKGQVSMHSFSIEEIPVWHVKELLSKLPDKPNMDILGYDTKLLKRCSDVLSTSLTSIFNQSIKEGSIPLDWKISKVTPAYKGKGDKEDPSNYRPISVAGHIPKIMEKLVAGQFISYLTDHHFITPDQSAYMEGHSSTTSLHRLVDDILDGANEGEVTAACFLDISKCFDSICHQYILQKLENYGIKDNLSWFRSYLTDRVQRVIHNGNLSKPQKVNSGVPQGSVLGPFIFILFANDLGNFVQGGLMNCYADDTVIYTYGATADDAKAKLEKCLIGVEHWYTENKLKVNVDKSKVMVFGSRQRLKKNNNINTKINFGKQPLENTTEYKYLGLQMDPTLSWDSQIQAVVKKSVFKLHLFRRLAKVLQPDTMLQLYKTYLMPLVEYGAPVWGYTSQANISKVDHIIHQAARAITNNYDYINIRGATLAKEKYINSFTERRDFLLAVETYKAINGLGPTYMQDKVTLTTEIVPHSTRGGASNNLYHTGANNDMFKSSFIFMAPKVWNRLSESIKNAPSVNSFKDSYKVKVLGQPRKQLLWDEVDDP